jgi:TPR repeat protein
MSERFDSLRSNRFIRPLLTNASENGNELSHIAPGLQLEEANLAQAVGWYERAAFLEHKDTQHDFGRCLELGMGTDHNSPAGPYF